MNAEENRAAWVQALRSGRYVQTRNVLRDGNTFCCLGVLCNLYREATDQGTWAAPEEMNMNGQPIAEARAFHTTIQSSVDAPPRVIPMFGLPQDPVLAWAGITDAQANSLATSNDQGESFEQIADRIELGKYDGVNDDGEEEEDQ